MSRPVTLRVVAEAAGVSVAAASQALNGTGALSDHTRARIIAAAASLGYVANRSAAALRSGRTNSIGFVLDTDDDDEFGDRRSVHRTRMLGALVREAARHNHTVTVFPTDRPDLLRATPIDVLYHPGTERMDDLISRAQQHGIRVIANDLAVQAPDAVEIRTGYGAAVRAGLDLLAAGGARHIGFLADAPGSLRTRIGEEAYWAWCVEHARDPQVSIVDARRRTLVPKIRALQDDGVDAIFAFSEDGPEIALHYDEVGMVLPRDMQLVTLCTTDCELNARLGVTRACVHPDHAPAALFRTLARGVLASPLVELEWEIVRGSTTHG